MKRLKKRMLANSGFSYVITSILMICVLLIGVAVFEVIRLYIQAGAVRDKFEDSIISMCVENYSEMYQPIRESHAASYRYNGFRWVNSSKANERYIRTYLSRAMNAGEIMQCEIVSVSFTVRRRLLHRIPIRHRNMRFLERWWCVFRTALRGRNCRLLRCRWTFGRSGRLNSDGISAVDK